MLIGKNSKALKKGDAEPPLAPGTARVYGGRFCPWAQRVFLTAAAKGIDIEIVNIDTSNKPEWYFNKHPQGKIPSFEMDGKILIESAVISEYLDSVFPTPAILPSDPFLRAKQQILLLQAAPFTTSLFGILLIFREKLEGEAREAKEKALENGLNVVEKLLTEDYFGGSSPGYADWMLYSIFERIVFLTSILSLASAFPNSTRWPSLAAWWTRLSEHPAVVEASQPAEVFYAYAKTFAAGKPDADIGI